MQNSHNLQPPLTIILTSYNYGHYIGEAIASVVGQSSAEWHLIIFDNCSTDNTYEVVEPFLKDPRISLVIRETNIGAFNNHRQALQSVASEFVATLQADDFLDPGFVETALRELRTYPDTPFVFFNWQHYLCDSKSKRYHDSLPLPLDRSGGARIGPLLTIMNFVPFHMAVFRTSCLMSRLDELFGSPLTQLGEQFVLKLLEDAYGPGCFSGTVGGVWRHHSGQLTMTHIRSSIGVIENALERQWYVLQAPDPDPANVFLALAAFVMISGNTPYPTAVGWLLTPTGKNLLRSHGLSHEGDLDHYQAMALAVAAKFSAYTSFKHLDRSAVGAWLQRMGCADTAQGLRARLQQVREREGDVFLNEEEIEDLTAYFYDQHRQPAFNTPHDERTFGSQPLFAHEYHQWSQARATPTAEERVQLERGLQALDQTTCARFCVAVDTRGDLAATQATLAALDQQILAPDRVLLIGQPLDALAFDAARVRWVEREEPGTYLPADCEAARHWVLGLVAGDVLTDEALCCLAQRIAADPHQAPVVYFDHDELDTDGRYANPCFKPAANPDLLRSTPYVGRALLIRSDWLAAQDAAPPRDLASAYRLALRAIEQSGEPGLAHEPTLLAHLTDGVATMWATSDTEHAALRSVLQTHIDQVEPHSTLLDGPAPGTFQWLPPLPQQPLVSIIVPTRDQATLLKRCIQSLLENTCYPNIEIIIVDNDSHTSEALHFFRNMERMLPEQVRVMHIPGPFNFSRMNNLAAREARGEYLLLLNNDAAALQEDWLTHMMRHAQRREVGAVGAGLYYPGGNIQHAGVVLGLNGPAEHPFMTLPANTPGYLYRAQLQQNYSAVTGACLLIRKAVYQDLGGLDETDLAVSFNDIDLCLRLRAAGKLVVWTPLALLVHDGNASQFGGVEMIQDERRLARFAAERAVMYRRWGAVIANDPAYNPNLSLRGRAFSIETNLLFVRNGRTAARAHPVLAFLTDTPEHGRYRFIQPLEALSQARAISGGILDDLVDANLILRSGARTLLLQQPRTLEQLETMENLVTLDGVTVVFDGDDTLFNPALRDIPAELRPDDLLIRAEALIRQCDRVVVSNAQLAAHFASLNHDVRIIPDRLDHGMWGDRPPQRSARPALRKPRVGWTDRACRPGDIEMIAEVIRSLASEVDWVCIGSCPEVVRPYLARHIDDVSAPEYPSVLMAQDWDLALAPHCGAPDAGLSAIRLAEYGWCGFAVACSDIPPYQDVLPALHIPNTVHDWTASIRAALADLAATRATGAMLQRHVTQTFMLNDAVLEDRLKAWTAPRTHLNDAPTPAAHGGGARPPEMDAPAALAERQAGSAPTADAPHTKTGSSDDTAADQPDDTEHSSGSEVDAESYQLWRQRRQPSADEWQFLPPLVPDSAHLPPGFHIIIRATPDDADQLTNTLASLDDQATCRWQLDIFSSAAAPAFSLLAGRTNVQWHTAPRTSDIKSAIDARVASLRHDFIVELPPGVRLDPLCLYRVAHTAQANGRTAAPLACFGDDDQVDADGARHCPRFKPSPDPDWVRSMDILGPIFVSAAAWHEAGGAASGPSLPWYDLALRILDRHGEQAFIHVSEPLLSLPAALFAADHASAGVAAVRRSLARQHIRAKVVRAAENAWRVTYPLTTTPLVTIAVPSLDKAEYLEQCMLLLLGQTTYPNYEVLIVDGGSQDHETRSLIDALQRRDEAPIRCTSVTGTFDLASFGSAAAAASEGELLLLLADDIRVVDPNWLSHLVGHILRDDIACVAPLIVGPLDGRIEAAGIIPGLAGFAGSPHQSTARIHQAGYLDMLRVDRAAAALSPHCLLLRTADLREVGGFDTQNPSAASAGLDLGLRLAGERRRCLATAGTSVVKLGASCLHALPLTQADMAQRQAVELAAQDRIHKRWFDAFACDRWWSRHLDRGSCNARLELRCIPSWHARPWPAPRILAIPVSNAQGLIRLDQPLNALQKAGKAHPCIFRPSDKVPGIPLAHDLARHQPDVIIAHLLVGLPSLMTIHQWRQLMPGIRLVYSIDDLFTDMPQKSSLRQGIPADARTYLMRLLEYFDRLVVSTDYLAEVYGPYAAETRVVPNRLERDVWMGLQPRRGTGARPRAGWAGGTAHEGDLQLIADVIAATANEVDWVFMGMCPDNIRPYIREFHPFSDYDSYPARLAALNLDIAVAPLEQIPFNRGKSNLRLLEYGALGIPVVCTDIDPYRNSPACRVPNRSRDWLEALRERIYDPDAATREGEAMRQWVVEHFVVEDHLDSWLDAHLPPGHTRT